MFIDKKLDDDINKVMETLLDMTRNAGLTYDLAFFAAFLRIFLTAAYMGGVERASLDTFLMLERARAEVVGTYLRERCMEKAQGPSVDGFLEDFLNRMATKMKKEFENDNQRTNEESPKDK